MRGGGALYSVLACGGGRQAVCVGAFVAGNDLSAPMRRLKERELVSTTISERQIVKNMSTNAARRTPATASTRRTHSSHIDIPKQQCPRTCTRHRAPTVWVGAKRAYVEAVVRSGVCQEAAPEWQGCP